MEIWKDIVGYEGKYQVSNFGRIKSFVKGFVHGKKTVLPKWKFISGCNSSNGYKSIKLCKNGEINNVSLHRLILSHFIPNPENKPCVNHKNGIKNDNRVENLEWCTHSENELHSYRVLGKKPNTINLVGQIGINHPRSKKIIQMSLSGEKLKTWDTITDASNKLNISRGNISTVANGKRLYAGGYKWKHV